MKKILFLLLTLALPALLLAAEPVREWTSINGQKIEASLDVSRLSDPEFVHLINAKGKHFNIKLDRLSQADQDYVKSVRKGNRSVDGSSNKQSRGIVVVPAGNRYALLIGVNQYAKPIQSLRYCVNDMELLADCIQKLGVPKENIILVTDNSSVDRIPTGAVIRRQIENITKLMEDNDQLFVAFSGHGALVDGKSYLCPSDTNLKDKNSIVSRDWVFEQLEKCKAKQKIFIVDACRDELSFGGGKSLGSARTLNDPIGADSHGFVLMASCKPQQQSWEDPDLKHGVFTYFLVEGLSGAAKDEDGYITIMSLFHYTSSKTKKYVFNNLSEVQIPMLRQGGEMTDFCLAKLDRPLSFPLSPTSPSPSSEPLPSPSLKAGDRKVETVNGVEFAFRWCPPGTFMMGSPESEEGRNDNETQHQVTLTKGFWMLETEVTQKQWKAVMGNNPSEFKGDDWPVGMVSWDDCQEFCNKCAQLGLPVQLPTEAQWEYACRAGTTGAYAGNLAEMAWYYNSISTYHIHPVGTKKPNAWGLYDMHGSVREWCQDWYGDYPSGSVTDPDGPSSGSYRVYRGGYWRSRAGDCRSANRSGRYPDDRDYFLGFRCVRSSDLGSSKTEDVKSTDENNDKESVEPVVTVVDKNAGKRAVKVINGVEFAFRWCPAGTFMMGSPSSEEGRFSNETQHQVTLTKGFWMMETEVTQKQWKAVMGNNPSIFKRDDLPVECVSWDDCQEFCKKCTQLGLPVQLPTEAQWEYACRAGTTGAYAGNLVEMAWYYYRRGIKTHPVGTKKPNAWGLYDMHGNVYEWCQDWYGSYPSGSVTDPTGPENGSYRVNRGGSWDDGAGYCRSACRHYVHGPGDRSYILGFRVVRSITRPEN